MRGQFGRAGSGRRLWWATLAGACMLALAGAPAEAARQPEQAVDKDLPDIQPPGDDALGRALARGDLTEAEYTLERVLAVFRPERARLLYGELEPASPREGTILLRDLAARLDSLAPAKRRLAERLLARPTGGADPVHSYRSRAKRACGARLCFWWVTRGADAPALVDRNRNRLPDWVDTTRSVFRTVWNREIGHFRYRRPLSDFRSRNHGPNGKLDVYIADIGRYGLYGYCTSDDPTRRVRRSVSAYCVVDDDFSRRQFDGSATGVRALKVTAAHEFFHAVQFSYDWLEDLWFMEGTATWMEDEVFDGVNDNLQYLRTSPVSTRLFWLPLDYYDPDPSELEANYKYGVWIFWRYLSERFGHDIVRSAWRQADSRIGSPRKYSLQAVVAALERKGADFPSVFTDFGVANLFPSASYSEGATYPAPRPTTVFDVGPAGTPRTRVPMLHLSNDYYALVPSGLPPTAALTLTFELPGPAASPRATALVERLDGTVVRMPATRDEATGAWRITVAEFGSARRVVLVMTNASTRFVCGRRTVLSCRGRPLDDVDFYFQAGVS